MRKKDRDAVADILLSITLMEAAMAQLQETLERERELMREAIKESEGK